MMTDKPFVVLLINVGYTLPDPQPTFEAALAAAKKAGLEANILRSGLLVATWSPISGLTIIPDSNEEPQVLEHRLKLMKLRNEAILAHLRPEREAERASYEAKWRRGYRRAHKGKSGK
jgi:hypothetical protein